MTRRFLASSGACVCVLALVAASCTSDHPAPAPEPSAGTAEPSAATPSGLPHELDPAVSADPIVADPIVAEPEVVLPLDPTAAGPATPAQGGKLTPGAPGAVALPTLGPEAADGPGRVRVLVRFAPGADRSAAQSLFDRVGARIAYRYRMQPDLIALRELPTVALEPLARTPGVVAVLPDGVRHANLAESRAVMNASAAQLAGFSDGTGVRVCVLDTGLNKSHPAFAGAVVAEHDFVNGDGDATDDEGHGTNVAGIIASRHATYGGVAPGAGLAIAKVLDADGSGYDADIIAAIEWCTLDAAGEVLNMSLGGGRFYGTCDWEPLAIAVNASTEAGVVNVVAAGNEGYANSVGGPACASRAITVGAVYDGDIGGVSWCLNGSCSQYCTDNPTAADKLVCFSNKAMKVDVTAPGSEIDAPDGLSSGFSAQSGTSQATPHVAGLVARLLGERPDLRPNDVRRWLWNNAADLGAAGFDVGYGHGRVDGLATLADATALGCDGAGDCDDGDACTTDACVGGLCAHDAACVDGDAGTVDSCNAGSCSHSPVTVSDGIDCTTDTLDACLGPRHTPGNGACHQACATAVRLPLGVTVTGSTSGASKAYSSTCPGYSNPGRDVVYRLYLRPDQPVTFHLATTSSWDPSMYLVTGTSETTCDVSRCIAGMDVGVNDQPETMANVTVPVAGYYYLIVDTYASSAVGSYALTVTATCHPDDEGRACDDGNECTANDVCQGGLCVAGPPPGCQGNGECDDGDACNGPETCSAGSCVPGTAPTCDDSDACTSDSCAPASGCVHVAITCDDGNVCTADACDPGVGCVAPPVVDGTSCADADACNGDETCQAGVCAAGVPIVCDDGDPCNGDETCAGGGCVASSAPTCDDGNPCTIDACEPGVGCVATAVVDGTSCADGDLCDGEETCQAGVCSAGEPVACDDGDLCNGAESCAAGVCQPGTPLSCGDGNVCTDDQCNAASGCDNVPLVGLACGDGDLCNGAEVCDATGQCAAGTPLSCDDGNGCTADSCHATNGCQNTPTPGASCGDGDACNGAEVCDGSGACAAGTPLSCDDGNPCTSDTCDPATGCTATPVENGTSCDDGDACTGADSCQSGACVGGASVCASPHLIFAVAASSLTLPGGLTVRDDDLAAHDLGQGDYAMYFDASDLGIASSEAINAVAVDAQGGIILSFETDVVLGGTTISPQDLVRFVPTSLGGTTAGTFSLYFDGSDVGLSGSSENIDAVAILPDGSLIISTAGSASVPGGVSAASQDLMRFVPTSLGAATAGSWSTYFDGSDVGLSSSGENVNGVAVLADGSILLTTTGGASAGGVAAADEDVLRFVPATLGASTSGSFELWFDGSANGFTNDINALDHVTL